MFLDADHQIVVGKQSENIKQNLTLFCGCEKAPKFTPGVEKAFINFFPFGLRRLVQAYSIQHSKPVLACFRVLFDHRFGVDFPLHHAKTFGRQQRGQGVATLCRTTHPEAAEGSDGRLKSASESRFHQIGRLCTS